MAELQQQLQQTHEVMRGLEEQLLQAVSTAAYDIRGFKCRAAVLCTEANMGASDQSDSGGRSQLELQLCGTSNRNCCNP